MAVYGIKKIFHSAVTDYHTTDKEGVGTLRFEGDKVYKYVQFVKGSGADAAAKNACLYSDATCHVVCCDASAGVAPAGILMSAIPTTNYGWIQVDGPCTEVNSHGTIAAGRVGLTVDVTDGKVDPVAGDGTDLPFFIGISLAAAASNKVSMIIKAF